MTNSSAKNRIKEIVLKIMFGTTAVIAVVATFIIFVFLFWQGIPAIREIGLFKFLFGKVWMPSSSDAYGNAVEGLYGIFPMIIGSIYATVGAVLIGGILGFFTAVYLSRFCPKMLKGPLTQLVNLLAGIPSVVYGFFGMRVLLPILGEFSPNGSGSGLLAVSIILGIMILPTVVSLSKTALDSVPEGYYEGARALGLTHGEAVFKTVVPAGRSGIVAGLILGIGRAVGETMAVIMVAGNNSVMPSSLFSSFRTMTANVVLEMGYAGELQLGALIATGCVLFFFVLVINVLFGLVNREKNEKGTLGGKKATSNQFWFKVKQFFAKIKQGLSANGKIGVKIKTALSFVSMPIAVVSLLSIVLFVLINGIPNINIELLTSNFAYGEAPTIMPSIVATIMLILLSLVIAIPLGIGSAIYLSEYANPSSKIVKIIRRANELLSGIPSIVYGLFGMVFFCSFMKLGTSILSGSLTIAIIILPVICRSTEESLKAVPQSYREGSFALGAGKGRTIFKVVLPSALAGVLSAVMLAIGRVLSESAPLMFTMGASLKGLPENGYLSSGTSLAVALYVLAGEGLHMNKAYATACVLIIMVFALNLLSTLFVTKLKKKFTKGE